MIFGDLFSLTPAFPGLKELIELYKELDLEAERFKKVSGLDCVKRCKQCCTPERAQIEASVFECLPLGIHLWKLGEADSFLQRISSGEAKNLCGLYNADDSALSASGCKHYAWRPLLCRLFGFSAVLDKHGQPRMALCRALKDADPQAEDWTNRNLARGLKPMILPHWAEKVSSLNPHLGQKRHPINLALRFALERVGFYTYLLQAGGDKSPGKEQEGVKENLVEKRYY